MIAGTGIIPGIELRSMYHSVVVLSWEEKFIYDGIFTCSKRAVTTGIDPGAFDHKSTYP